MRRFLVVSGVPASGKTTLARSLANRLGYEFLDKDVFLESLFELHPVAHPEVRRQLSARADQLFQTVAMTSSSAVLASWWRHPRSQRSSGTSTDWLKPSEVAAEVHCCIEPASRSLRPSNDFEPLGQGECPSSLQTLWPVPHWQR